VNKSVERITLDVQNSNELVTVEMRQGDTARRIEITLTDGGFPYKIAEGCYAMFAGLKPDNHIILNHCKIENDTIIYDVTPQTTAAAGKMAAQVRVYGADDTVLTSARFLIDVQSAVVTNELIASSSEFSELIELLRETSAVIGDANDAADEARDAAQLALEQVQAKVYSRAVVYCWGDSLTQGIGGNVNGWHLMSYPQMLSQRVNAVNLGIMSDDVPTIQARQGSDPVLLPGFTLPASSLEKVAIGAVMDGLPTRSGKIAKLLRYGDAGLNPCYVDGIQCYLSRDYKADTTDGTTFYIRRAEDGQAVEIPAGTELETFAARHYRGNGIHIFWMGANGGYGTSANGLEFEGYLQRLRECVDFAGVESYFIIYARERKGYTNDEEGEIQQIIDNFGAEHVIRLLPALVERGLLYAETNRWDGELVNGVPRVLDSGDGCHYSFYGYQAIAGIVWEHIAPCVSKGSTGNVPAPPDLPTGDDFGTWAYKLRSPRTLTASGSGLTTNFQPFREPGQQWTIAVKFRDFAPATEGGNAVIVWAEANSETVHARCSVYIENGHTATDPMCMLGSGGFRINPTGFTLSEDGCHYLTLVRDASQWGAWLDGNWMYGAMLGYDIGDITSSDQLVLGQFNKTWKATGRIEDVRIYDAAFDDDTVKQLYLAMQTGSTQ